MQSREPICSVVVSCGVGEEDSVSIRGVGVSCGVGEESRDSIGGVGVSCGVGEESPYSIRSVGVSRGVESESIVPIRGVIVSCGVGSESKISIRRVASNIPSSSSYCHSIHRSICRRHQISTRTRETHTFYIVAFEYDIDIVCCSDEVGSCDSTSISCKAPT